MDASIFDYPVYSVANTKFNFFTLRKAIALVHGRVQKLKETNSRFFKAIRILLVALCALLCAIPLLVVRFTVPDAYLVTRIVFVVYVAVLSAVLIPSIAYSCYLCVKRRRVSNDMQVVLMEENIKLRQAMLGVKLTLNGDSSLLIEALVKHEFAQSRQMPLRLSHQRLAFANVVFEFDK